MKHGKRPTRAQKEFIKKLGYDAEEWLVSKDGSECFAIVKKGTGEIKVFKKTKPGNQ